MELEIIRAIVAIAMLSTAAYFDLRYREVHDYVWIVFGGIGAFLHIFETPSYDVLPGVFFGVFIFGISWKYRLIAASDCFVILAFSIILPIFAGVLLLPMAVLLLTLFFAIGWFVSRNIGSNYIKYCSGQPLFEDIDEPLYKKIFAFFVIREKNLNDKYCFSVVFSIDGKNKFRFRPNPNEEPYAIDSKYIMPTYPFIIPFLISTILIVLGLSVEDMIPF